MRVIAGAWRGRPLKAPRGHATRPTSDRVREAVFGMLPALPELGECLAACAEPEAFEAPAERAAWDPMATSLAGHRVLDLFAGSGALGIEALSRGADSCTFVESGAPALRVLRENLERLGVPSARGGETLRGAARVLACDVRRALTADARRCPEYTLVFADPPYDLYGQVRPILTTWLGRVLAPRGVVVVETAAATTAGLSWPVVREKRYGDTRVTVYATGSRRIAEGATADDDPSGH
jgi:16S rRNA (guanine966-N2)-methyltransferase